MDDNTHVGFLINGDTFHCLDCAEDKHCPVYRVNVGIYSQTCAKCRKVIVKGVQRADKTGPLNLFDGGLN